MASRSTFLTGHRYDSALNANSDTNRPSMWSESKWSNRSPALAVGKVGIGRIRGTNGTPAFNQNGETSRQHRPHFPQTLNVRQRARLGPSLPAVLLDSLFDHSVHWFSTVKRES